MVLFVRYYTTKGQFFGEVANTMQLRNAVLTLGIALLSVGSLAAQETTGRIEGRVLDPGSATAPGVTVTATGPQGAKTATTDTDGRFTVPFLTPGTYQLLVELDGFKTIEKNDMTVSLGQVVTLEFKLEVGGHPRKGHRRSACTPIIDTRSTAGGGVIDGDFVRTVPTLRRISDVTYMAPGVSNSGIRRTAEPVDFRRQRSR